MTDFLLHHIRCMRAGEVIPYPWQKKEEHNPLPEFGSMPMSEMGEWLDQEWIEVEDGSIEYR